ncbi:MAG: hypothetical protein FWC70_12855, partial [Defluviitaleaceae bacterium]|nr:hypothetical protein [Defluviitaleaceae bacterium]
MFSEFGVIAIIVALISIGALVLHFYVMKRRVASDKCLAEIDALLRTRIELLYETQPREVHEILAATFETRSLLAALAQAEIRGSELCENIIETEIAVRAYNDAVAVYNDCIAKYPAKIMAFLLGLSREEDMPNGFGGKEKDMLSVKWFMGEREDLSEIYAIRREVFVDEQGVSEEEEFDDTDGSCAHLLMYDDGLPVATGR